MSVEVTYPADRPWEDGADAVRELGFVMRPESFTVESIDEQAHKVLLRTTPFARDLLRHWGAKVAGPEDSARRPECARMFFDFTIGKTAPPLNDDEPTLNYFCGYAEYIDPERMLLVEGLDAARKRLFVASSPDSRWHIYETVDDKGQFSLLGRGREESAITDVDFAAPIYDERLSRLRIWQLNWKGKGKVIGTVILTGAGRK